MQLSSIPCILVASLLIVGVVAITPSTARAQNAQSQTITSGIVKLTAPVGSGRLWVVHFTNQAFVAYANVPPPVGTEVPIEILSMFDINGVKHDVAYVMTPKK